MMETSLLAGYNAVRESAGILDLSDRGKVRVAGADRIDFLHAMISNDVRGLSDYQGAYATLLNSNGRMVADFVYYRLPEYVLIDVAGDLVARLVEALDKYIIMDDVLLENVSGTWTHLSVQGPRSAELIESLLGVKGTDKSYALVPADFSGSPAWVATRAELSDEGFEVLLPEQEGDRLMRAGLERGGVRIEPEAAEILRLERGVPKFGVDMSDANNPLEAGLRSAISLDKGCYLGQEVVSKATYVGQVNRRLVRFQLEYDRRIEPGARLLSEEGRPIGQLTSSVVSPALGRTIALGYVKKEWAAPGQSLLVEQAARRLRARVEDVAIV